MLKNRTITIILIISCVFIMVSCSNDVKEDSGYPIRVYLSPYDEIMMEAVGLFRKNHATEINEAVFSDMNEYYEQTVSELLKGGGPDIILIDPLSRDTDKLIQEGVFLDINELIKNDPDFTTSVYHEIAINGIEYNNKKYMVPISYSAQAFVSTEQIMDNTGIDITGNRLSSSQLQEIAEKAVNSAGRQIIDSSFTFCDMLTGNGIGGRHFYTGSEDFYEKELADMLRTYKALYKRINMEANDPGQLLIDGKCIFIHIDDVTNPDTLLKDYAEKKYGDNRLRLYSLASEQGEVYAVPRIMAGINKNCKNPDAAYNFIKTLLDKNIQSMESFMYTPVNLEAYRTKLSKNMNNRRAEEIAEEIKILQENITGEAYMDYGIEMVLNNGIKEYMEDKKTIEETIINIRNSMNGSTDEDMTGNKGVSSDESTSSLQDNSGSDVIEDINKLKMIIYYSKTQEAVDAVRRYNLFSSGCEIDVETIRDKDTFTNKLTTSIMAGTGSDIIVTDPELLPSINNMIRNGMFEDLNTLIENDPEFEPDDYFKQVFDNGLYGGKRYYIPFRYMMPVLFTTDEILGQNNISIDESDWTWDRALEIADRLEKFLFSELDFYDILRSSEPFIDYEQRVSRFNSKEFIKLLEIYEKIHPFICTPEELEKYEDGSMLLQSGKGIFLYDEGSFVQLFGNNSLFEHLMNQEARMISMPTVTKGKQAFVEADLIVGINAACKYKEDAYKYMKILINKSLTDPLYRTMPVHKESYNNIKNHYITNGEASGYISISGNPIRGIPILDSHINLLDRWVVNIQRCSITDTSVKDIIDEQVYKYLDGAISADKAAKIIDEKISIFLNE